MNTDIQYMGYALELARRGLGRTLPNPMVGCVIIRQGKLVGEGWHKRCGGPHAEILALRQAKGKTSGATMYVTLEPCAHQGRTPPCVDQVIASGIKRVVIGSRDPNPGVNGRSIKKLKRAGVEVVSGLLRQEAQALNAAFHKYITQQVPFVTVKIAQSLDGKVAASSGQSKWITSAKTRLYARQQRNAFDAILVGINTVLKDDPQLSPALKSKPWTKIVLDSSLKIPLKARLLDQFSCLIATTPKASARKKFLLEKKGVSVVVCPTRAGQVDLLWLMKYLAGQEISNVLIEGGSTVIGQALAAKIVDRMVIYIAPKIFGDEDALSSVGGLKVARVDQTIGLKDIRLTPIGNDFCLEGNVCYAI